MDEIINEVKKKQSLQKKQLMPFCLQTKDLFVEIFNMLKENITNEMSNVRLAQLNRLAYQDSLKRSLMKKINRRVGENAGMLDEIDNKVGNMQSLTLLTSALRN